MFFIIQIAIDVTDEKSVRNWRRRWTPRSARALAPNQRIRADASRLERVWLMIITSASLPLAGAFDTVIESDQRALRPLIIAFAQAGQHHGWEPIIVACTDTQEHPHIQCIHKNKCVHVWKLFLSLSLFLTKIYLIFLSVVHSATQDCLYHI